MALRRIKQSGGSLKGRDWAIAGIVTGCFGFLLMLAVCLPSMVRVPTNSQMNACINNLRLIDGAKQQWALEHGKGPNDVPAASDLQPYLGRGATGELPYCLADPNQAFSTSYSVNNIATKPTCKISPSTHSLA